MTSFPTPWSGPAPALQAVVDDLLAHYSDLRRYLCGRLRNPDDAADIAQSSFAQAYAYALNAPGHVNLDLVTMRPVAQSAQHLLARGPLRPRGTEEP